jgi:hypothetical protein
MGRSAEEKKERRIGKMEKKMEKETDEKWIKALLEGGDPLWIRASDVKTIKSFYDDIAHRQMTAIRMYDGSDCIVFDGAEDLIARMKAPDPDGGAGPDGA